MVGGAGLFDSAADLRKSDGMRINLWTGIGMLVLGLLFLLWAFLRPVQHGGDAGEE
jgi:xanthine/uracil/vitamin C permease (AzgA family)